MTLSAVLCGADKWVDVAEWAGDNEDWFKNTCRVPCDCVPRRERVSFRLALAATRYKTWYWRLHSGYTGQKRKSPTFWAGLFR